ncbi:DMT family transporter [Methylobacter sp. YRD-M1]|uniref:DMT family transporter n=1 Tax=Methylobacter sp. YRD-M1 TaxID=2911520 RepID=UPI00227D4259|nr:DMT family transporter [Methylobacter sp. YRD-M1]WAK02306.1 DMT family transporter [Methylobacter sp. YRD-M1]
MEIFFVFGRLLLSSVSNVFQKQLSHHGLHPFYIVAATYAVLAVLSLLFFFNTAFAHLSASFWINVLLAALFDVGGWMFMVMSLSKTDLSIFGPLNAYKVIISMLFALVFLGEVPTLQGFAGIMIIVAGSFLLLPPSTGMAQSRLVQLWLDRGVQARFLSILLFSIGTVFLKGSLEHSGPLETLIFWSLFGLPLILLANAFLTTERLADNIKNSQPHVLPIAAAGMTVFVMQYLTLVLLSQMLIAYALALFQLGMLLQVFLGYKIFNEPDLLRRLMASLVMIAGSLLVLQGN